MEVERKENYTQVCVWPGTIVVNEDYSVEDFVRFMTDTFGVRVQYLEEIKTKPDMDKYGDLVPNTGGRNDLFFAVHIDDIAKFAIHRLQYGIMWIEDVLATCNYRQRIYPDYVFNYVTWNKEHITFPTDFTTFHKK